MSDIQIVLDLIQNMKPDAVFGIYGFIVILSYAVLKYSVYLSLVYILYIYLKKKKLV